MPVPYTLIPYSLIPKLRLGMEYLYAKLLFSIKIIFGIVPSAE